MTTQLFNILNETDSYGGALIGYKNANIEISFGKERYDKKNDDKTMYRIFSLSKAITATAILLLVQKGRLKLSSHIGIGKLKKLKNHKNVRIIDLLDHKSGLFDAVTYVFFDKGSDIYHRLVPKDRMKTNSMSINDIIYVINKYQLSDNPTAFQNRSPKGRFKYNNTNYDILGYILDYKTHGHAYDFIRDNIFDPLCMDADFMSTANNTTFPFQSSRSYGVREHQGKINGNANIVSTLRGYALFLNGYHTLMTKGILKKFQNLYFFQKRGKKRYFYATGSGDFPTYGKYRQLSKSVVVYDVDHGTIFIASQNYMGKKMPLIFQYVSFKRNMDDYEKLYEDGKMKVHFEDTIFGIIMNTLFSDIIS